MYKALVRCLLLPGLFLYTGIAVAQNNSAHDVTEKFSIYERNLQELLNKIEILEHNVSTLQQQVNKLLANSAKNNEVDLGLSSKPEQDTNLLVTQEVFLDINAPSRNEEQAYQRALLTFKEVGNLKDKSGKTAKFLVAQEQFEKFLQEHPNSQLSANAYFWLGEISFRLGEMSTNKEDFARAVLQYMQAYNRAKKLKNDKAMDALLKIGISLGKLGKQQKACQIFKKLDEEFPLAERTEDFQMQTKEACEKYNCKITQ